MKEKDNPYVTIIPSMSQVTSMLNNDDSVRLDENGEHAGGGGGGNGGNSSDSDDTEAAAAVLKEKEIFYDGDYVSVKLGPDLTNLRHVGTYRYKVNPDTGTILYDIKETVKCRKLAFRFDFCVTDPKAPYQVCISYLNNPSYQHIPSTNPINPTYQLTSSLTSPFTPLPLPSLIACGGNGPLRRIQNT